MKQLAGAVYVPELKISVLSVEPYGMKPAILQLKRELIDYFSALGRAVWDETCTYIVKCFFAFLISVLSVEPYGMKLLSGVLLGGVSGHFSALGRAVWDETILCLCSANA